MDDARKIELYEAEVEALLEKVGRVAMKQDLVASMQEGAWTGSMGGHDPDFNKLRGGLKEWWIKTVRTKPHPFTYCVRHLSKHVANPERLCAWLKDQAMNTTKWRKGNKKNLKESDVWMPSIEELRAASAAFTEAEEELDEEIAGGSGASANAGGSGDDGQKAGEQSGSASTEDEGEGARAKLEAILADPDASDSQKQQAADALAKLDEATE